MALVVFLRGVNVGGRKTFRPSVFVKALAALDVVNVGAAGTFVVRKRVGQAVLRAELQAKLTFSAELMICSGRDIVTLAEGEPFPAGPASGQVRRFVSILARRPRNQPSLPISSPAGAEWKVKVMGVTGVFVLSLWQRRSGALVYPNGIVEKSFGVPATTRGWNTITAIREILAP